MWLVMIILVQILLLISADDFEKYYLGCFRRASPKVSSDRHSETPDFSNCIKQCFGRKHVFAGYNDEECFCSDVIQGILVAINSTNCKPCSNVPNQHCGGSSALSLYKIFETKAFETNIIYATENGSIKQWIFENVTLSFKDIGGKNYSISSFVSRGRLIKYVLGKDIVDGTLFSERLHSQVELNTDCTHIGDLAINWNHYTLYWSCRDTKSIHWGNGPGNISHIHSGEVTSIAIDPYRKFLLYLKDTELVKYNLNTSSTTVLKMNEFPNLKQFALDIQQEKIYLICSKEDDKNYLLSVDYCFTKFDAIYSGPELHQPFGMDAVNGTIVWGSVNNDSYILYKARVSNPVVNVTILLTETEKILDFKMDTYESRGASTTYLCEKKNCSHLCIRMNASKVACQCYDHFVLSKDQRTCVEDTESNSYLLFTLIFLVVSVLVICITIKLRKCCNEAHTNDKGQMELSVT